MKTYDITPTIRLSTQSRRNLAMLIHGYPLGPCAMRHLVMKGAVTPDGKVVPEVARSFRERYA